MLNNTQNTPGIICPNKACGHKITVTLQDLLFQKSLKCPHCLLELTMDRERSKETISAMDKLNAAIKNAETAKNFEGRPRA